MKGLYTTPKPPDKFINSRIAAKIILSGSAL